MAIHLRSFVLLKPHYHLRTECVRDEGAQQAAKSDSWAGRVSSKIRSLASGINNIRGA